LGPTVPPGVFSVIRICELAVTVGSFTVTGVVPLAVKVFTVDIERSEAVTFVKVPAAGVLAPIVIPSIDVGVIGKTTSPIGELNKTVLVITFYSFKFVEIKITMGSYCDSK